MGSNASFASAPAFESVTGDRLTHFFGDVTPLVDASFRLERGDCVALRGANGAGKSTLMRILGALLRPHEGRVLIDGDIDAFEHRDVYRPRIGWVAHDVMLYPDLTGRENLRLWADLHGVRHDMVEAWLKRVGVAYAGDRVVRDWSRGMKQRLALARSLVHEPTLVLWDEPTSGLDAEGQALLGELLQLLVDSERICVCITHQVDSSFSAINRVLLLEDARLLEHEERLQSAAVS